MTTPLYPGTARRPTRRRIIHGDPSLIVGPPWTHALYWLVLLAAAGVDLVTFHQVLLQAIDETELFLWVLVAGFTVIALSLSHTVGMQARQGLGPRGQVGGRTIAWLCLVGWSMLGAVAFFYRYHYIEPASAVDSVFVVDGQQSELPGSADQGGQHLSALLFLAFYVGTGLVSGTAGFLRHEPAARRYVRALRQRTKAAERQARTGAILAGENETLAAITRMEQRTEEDWAAARSRGEAWARRLKSEARLFIASRQSSALPAPGNVSRADGEEPVAILTDPAEPAVLRTDPAEPAVLRTDPAEPAVLRTEDEQSATSRMEDEEPT